MKAQDQKNVTVLVKVGHCELVCDRTLEVMGDIRDYNPVDYKYVGVYGFYFKYPGKANRVELLK